MRFPSPIRIQLQATSLIGVVLAMITLAGAPAPAMAQYDYPDAPPADDTAATPSESDSATPVASDCDPEAAAAAAPEVYAIDGAASTAKYVAQQEVVTFGAQEVVGSTNAIIGSILFDDERRPLECSSFAVDMRTLVTDEPMRDNYLRGNTLESDTFPFATFVVASVAGLDGSLTDGEPTSIQLVGDLTLHGVTRPATWEAEVTVEGDTLTGTASTTFAIADYKMEKPIVGPVLSIEDEIELDVEITATSEA